MGAVTKALANVVEADDAAGATLIGMAVYDYLTDQAAELGADLDRLYGAWALDRIGVAKRQLGRSYVEKTATGVYPDDSVQMTAQWLAGLEAYVVDAVAKAGEFEGWANRVIYRNEKGQWARDLSGSGRPNVQARMENKPEKVAPSVKAIVKPGVTLDPDLQERLTIHQGQYEQAGRLLAQMMQGFTPEERKGIEGVITLSNPAGQIDEIAFPLAAMKGGVLPKAVGDEWDLNDHGLSVSIQAGRGASPEVERRVAAFNTLGAVGGTALQRLAEVEPARWDKFAESIKMPERETDTTALTRFFNQLSAGGRVLAQISGQERMGEWAQFVGSMGPQAEQVLGPYVQRAAYRYRGTEKTPDPELVQMLGASQELVTRAQAIAPKTGLRGDSLKMQARADLAAAHLARTLPRDPILRRLSEKSGNVLPSQGVLIDAEGDVVSQAVGYADDHYLPFDLKGLAKLRGGQYIRTRMAGGPTAEDIYTAVHTGARMLTVVSPSGVYTLEFDPAFRGARAGSDKARQMNDRYIKILDAVKGSGLYLQDIDPIERNGIEADVQRMFPGDDPVSREARDTAREKRLNAARMKNMSLSPEVITELESQARADLGIAPEGRMSAAVARQYEDVLADKIEERRSGMVNQLRLNGEGYATALGTLQQQFPYFLKTPRFQSYAQFREDMNIKGREAAPSARYATDAGYVGPGGLRPGSVQSGYYDYQGRTMEPKSQRNARTTPDAPQAPAGDTPAATPNATSTQSTATTATPETGADATAPQGGVWSRLRANRPILDKQRQSTAVQLMSQIGGIADEYRANGNAIAQMDSKSALQSDPETLAKWFLTRDPKEIKGLLDAADTDAAVGNTLLPVLQNEALMTKAFTDVMGGSRQGFQDYFAEGNRVGGADNFRDAATWVSDTALTIANLTYAREPFVAPIADRDASERHTGLKPQGFDDLTSIMDRATFQQAWRDNPELSNLATQLMESEDGVEMSIGQTAKAASDRIAALNALEAARPKLLQEDPDAFAEQGVTAEELAATLGVVPMDLRTQATEMDFSAERNRTQRAWTLATVGRLLQYLPARDGGDVDPKAWDPLGSLTGGDVEKQDLDWVGLVQALRVPGMLLPSRLLR
jgi:hypothetical protein